MKPETESSAPGFLYPPVLRPRPLPSKVSCSVSMCVCPDNSFPSVRREPLSGPGSGPLSDTSLRVFFKKKGKESGNIWFRMKAQTDDQYFCRGPENKKSRTILGKV